MASPIIGRKVSKKFYSLLLDDVVMLFPGGMLIDGKRKS